LRRLLLTAERVAPPDRSGARAPWWPTS